MPPLLLLELLLVKVPLACCVINGEAGAANGAGDMPMNGNMPLSGAVGKLPAKDVVAPELYGACKAGTDNCAVAAVELNGDCRAGAEG